MVPIRISISPGEYFDRLTILDIKRERTTGERKREAAVQFEALRNALRMGCDVPVTEFVAELKMVNETIWNLEDGTRRKEAEECWDSEFVEMARGIFHANDRRAAIKRRIDELLGSTLSEVKEYAGY